MFRGLGPFLFRRWPSLIAAGALLMTANSSLFAQQPITPPDPAEVLRVVEQTIRGASERPPAGALPSSVLAVVVVNRDGRPVNFHYVQLSSRSFSAFDLLERLFPNTPIRQYQTATIAEVPQSSEVFRTATRIVYAVLQR